MSVKFGSVSENPCVNDFSNYFLPIKKMLPFSNRSIFSNPDRRVHDNFQVPAPNIPLPLVFLYHYLWAHPLSPYIQVKWICLVLPKKFIFVYPKKKKRIEISLCFSGKERHRKSKGEHHLSFTITWPVLAPMCLKESWSHSPPKSKTIVTKAYIFHSFESFLNGP